MEPDRKILAQLVRKVSQLVSSIDKAAVAEYIELYRNPWRILYLNFLSGVMRGFGIAVGFSIVGALLLWGLGRLAALNLPIIGEFIAEIVRIVKSELSPP